MRFTVIWRPQALDVLAALWISSNDRRSINDAVDEVDRLLRDDPGLRGEEFYGDRLLVVDRLSFTFRVREEDRIVDVLDLWNL
jgi:hypothetical protein